MTGCGPGARRLERASAVRGRRGGAAGWEKPQEGAGVGAQRLQTDWAGLAPAAGGPRVPVAGGLRSSVPFPGDLAGQVGGQG